MFFTHPVYLTCMSFFLLLNTKEDIVKNVGNQIVDVWWVNDSFHFWVDDPFKPSQQMCEEQNHWVNLTVVWLVAFHRKTNVLYGVGWKEGRNS